MNFDIPWSDNRVILVLNCPSLVSWDIGLLWGQIEMQSEVMTFIFEIITLNYFTCIFCRNQWIFSAFTCIFCRNHWFFHCLYMYFFSAGIIGFFTAFGMLLSKMGEKGKIMVDFFSILNHIIMEMVNIIMWWVELNQNSIQLLTGVEGNSWSVGPARKLFSKAEGWTFSYRDI